jgi:hypothetical protein
MDKGGRNLFFKKWKKRTTIPILSSALFLAGCSVPLVAAANHRTVTPNSDSKSVNGSLTRESSQFHTAAYDGDSDETHAKTDVDKPSQKQSSTTTGSNTKLASYTATSKSKSNAKAHAGHNGKTSTKTQSQSTTKQNLKPKVTSLFHLHTNKNMQGVTAYGSHVYAAFDLGHGKGEIREYTLSGHLVKNSGPLAIGHSASLSYNQANGLIYVTNGGQTHATKVSEVNMNLTQPRVVRTVDLGSFGHSGLVAIDNVHHRMWVHTAANDHAPITFRYCTMSGKVLKKFTIHNLGVPQGLQVYNGRLYYYTDNKITVLSEQGNILRTLHIHLGGESEGLALVHGTQPYFIAGFHSPNRYYTVRNLIPS